MRTRNKALIIVGVVLGIIAIILFIIGGWLSGWDIVAWFKSSQAMICFAIFGVYSFVIIGFMCADMIRKM